MSNKAALRKKVEEQLNNIVKEITKDGGKLDRILNSGAIDLSAPESGYTTSHQILCALGRYIEEQHTPSAGGSTLMIHKREVKNIEICS